MTQAAPLRLDTTACDRCGRCTPLCKPGALRIGPGYISVDWEKCTACGKCASACDTGAIAVRGAAAAVPRGGSVVPIRPAGAKVPKRSAARDPRRTPAPKEAPRANATAPGPGAAVAWTLPEAVLVLVVAFALLIGVQALPGGIGGAPVWAGLILLAYDAALGGLLWFLARRRGVASLAAFRLDAVPAWRTMALAVAVAAGCWSFSMAYRAVALGLGATPPASDGVDLTRVFGSGVAGVVLTVVVVAVLGPLLEEVLLRGVALGAAAGRFGRWPAIVGCAVAFALLHASLWSLLPLTVLGVGLGWLAMRDRSLWPAVAAHVLYNVVLVAAALYAAR